MLGDPLHDTSDLRGARARAGRAAAANARPRDPQRSVPPLLYLPVRLLPDGSRIAERLRTTDERVALLAFTALDRLVDSCGPSQAWAVVEVVALDALQAEQPFDLVAFDPAIPIELLEGGRLS